MRNWTRCSGVYCNMLRVPLLLACWVVAVAQPSPQPDPLQAAIQAVWQARNSGHTEEVVAARETARALIQRAQVDSPQFAGWAQQVAQLYQGSNLNAQARAVLEGALARTGPLGASHPSRISLLTSLGDSWQEDGNLLKAVGYLEQAAAAQAAPAPQVRSAQPAVRMAFFSGPRVSYGDFGSGNGSAIYAYTRLAALYRRLGRPDAAAGVAVKIRALSSNDPMTLARFYEQAGTLEEAAALYRKVAEQSADPQTSSSAWQSLANVCARQEDYAGAAGATRQAIAAVPPSDRSGAMDPNFWVRQNLAGYLRQAGQLDQADQIYRQLVEENRGGSRAIDVLVSYAQHLTSTNRAAQGESLLQDYLAARPNLDWQQQSNVLYEMANIARWTRDLDRAQKYVRAAQALQPPQPPQPPPPGQILITGEIQKAQGALNQHRWDDAYSFALHAIDIAPQAADGQQVEWFVPQAAQQLAANKEPARAEQLFQRLLAQARSQSSDGIRPLINATQNYARFLANQPDRLHEVPAAIEQYRRVLTEANGPESASLAEPLRLTINFERSHVQWPKAEAATRELLELEASLSGDTSEPYVHALQTLAEVHEAAGNSIGALASHRKTVPIADLLATPENAWLRGTTRMNVAFALARLGQFDEAETLGEQAVALTRTPRTRITALTQQLEQIRSMKQAAATARISADRLPPR